MKMSAYILASALLSASIASAARADQLSLNYIDTDDCAKAQKEISLLSKPSAGIIITAVCSDAGAYASDNGRTYAYRLYTTLSVAGSLYSGLSLQLADIDTNSPAYAAQEAALLNSSAAQVQVTTSDYSPGAFGATNGRTYDYRVYTTLTVN